MRALKMLLIELPAEPLHKDVALLWRGRREFLRQRLRLSKPCVDECRLMS